MLVKHTTLDIEVGRRIQQRRKVLGITATEMAKKIGVSYQQLYKYETGENRVSAATLHDISFILGVDIDYFFKAGEYKETSTMYGNVYQMPPSFQSPSKILNDPETMRLVKTFIQIDDHKVRNAIIEISANVAAYVKRKKKK